MSLLSKDYNRLHDKELKQQLRVETEKQVQILKKENLQRLQKIGYVRPRTRLQLLYADEYMTNKQYANVLGLEQVVKLYPELSDEQIQSFVIRNKVSLVFLNRLIKLVPDAISVIRTDGANKVVFRYARILEHNKENRRKLL